MGVYSGLSLYWPELTEAELRGVIAELEDWVARARVANRRLDDVLRECWPLHPGAVHQLSAWQAWWWAIYRPRLGGDVAPRRRRPQRAGGDRLVGLAGARAAAAR